MGVRVGTLAHLLWLVGKLILRGVCYTWILSPSQTILSTTSWCQSSKPKGVKKVGLYPSVTAASCKYKRSLCVLFYNQLTQLVAHTWRVFLPSRQYLYMYSGCQNGDLVLHLLLYGSLTPESAVATSMHMFCLDSWLWTVVFS